MSGIIQLIVINQKNSKPFVFSFFNSAKHIIWVLFLSGLFVAGSSQESVVRNINFYSQKQGLSSYNVHKIIQDTKNFIWIATQDGLDRFDGREFTVYNKGLAVDRALFSNDISNIFLDSVKNLIWVICNNGGVNGVDVITGRVKYSFKYNDPRLNTEWRACACYLNNKIYIGTTGGIEIFNTVSYSFEQVNQKILFFSDTSSKIDIRAITADKNSNVWISAFNKGIFIFNPQQNKIIKEIPFTQFRRSANELSFWPNCSIFLNDHRYWVGTKEGLYELRFDKNYNLTPAKFNGTELMQFAKAEITCLFMTNNGEILIPGDKLCRYHINLNKLQKISPSYLTASQWLKNITYCFQDNKKNIWFGCKQGLGFIGNDVPSFYPTANDRNFDYKLGHVFSVCALNSNQTLAGTIDGAFLLTGQQKIEQVDRAGQVQNIFRLTPSDILLSGDNGVRLFFNGKVEQIEKRYPEFSIYKSWQFNSSIHLDSNLTMIGTENNMGILLWYVKQHKIVNVNEKIDSVGTKPAFVPNNVNTVFNTHNGDAVILSDYSITIFDPKTFTFRKVLPEEKDTSFGIFMDMAETKSNFWINAYSNGLLKLDKNFKVLKIYGESDGVSNTGLYKIFNYRDSLLVLSSNYGISVFDIKREKFNRYFEEDGLQNNTFEEASGDVWEDRFYAGGVNGFVTIDPSHFKPAAYLPEVFFTKVETKLPDNKLTDTSNLNSANFEISKDALQTNIFFAGLYYNNPLRVVYAYRLKELDNTWINLSSQNFVSIIGLAPGTYTLQVKAANEDGVWSDVKELQLIFLPKWYQTWLFKAGVIAVVAALLYALYRYRLRQILKVERMRRKLSSDLHDDIGSTLNSVNLFARMAMLQPESDEYLPHIKEGVQSAIASVRDIIWILDKQPETIESVFNRINAFAQPLAKAAGCTIETMIEPTLTHYNLHGQEKQNVYLVMKEAVNNCIKYAGCRAIAITAARVNNQLTISIADDGKGFEIKGGIAQIAEGGSGNGLKNMLLRCNEIKWKLTVESALGKGTAIKLTGKIRD